MFQRQELQKFAKMMRQRRPNSNFSLQYDKLIIDNEIYMFNDMTGRVEEVSLIATINTEIHATFLDILSIRPIARDRQESLKITLEFSPCNLIQEAPIWIECAKDHQAVEKSRQDPISIIAMATKLPSCKNPTRRNLLSITWFPTHPFTRSKTE